MDLLTLSIGIGLLTSLAFTELFGLAVGGMIVPGYIALCLREPASVVTTIVAALATLAVVKLVSRWAIVYGRRRVVLTIIIGFLVGAVFRQASLLLSGLPADGGQVLAVFSVIGFIIPGLIALWMERQGIVETLAPLMLSAVVVRLTLIVLGVEAYV
jgi:poly-gamma-glutamate biosynthesis protein PgsC/CapC